jgi:hypothetical protein
MSKIEYREPAQSQHELRARTDAWRQLAEIHRIPWYETDTTLGVLTVVFAVALTLAICIRW